MQKIVLKVPKDIGMKRRFEMKKGSLNQIQYIILLIFLIVSFFGLIFSASYLVINAKEIPGKISEMKKVDSASNQNTESNSEKSKKIEISGESDSNGILKMYIAFLKKISVDLSAVTPFIWLSFFIFLGKGSYKMLKHDFDIKSPDTFPFPRRYETTWLQWGFTGTIWGFLIIGIRMSKIQTSGSTEILDILVKAFGTALLSTFTAVFMVYIFTPNFKRFFQGVIDYDPDQIPEGNINMQLRELSEKLGESRKKTEALTYGIENLSEEIDTLKSKVIPLSPGAVISGIKELKEISDNQLKLLKNINEKKDKVTVEVKEGKTLELLKEISDALNSFSNISKTKLEDVVSAIKEEGIESRKTLKAIIEDSKRGILTSVQNTVIKMKGKIINLIEKLRSEENSRINGLDKKINDTFSKNKKILEDELGEIKEKSQKIDERLEQKVNLLDQRQKKIENRITSIKKEKAADKMSLSRLEKFLTLFRRKGG